LPYKYEILGKKVQTFFQIPFLNLIDNNQHADIVVSEKQELNIPFNLESKKNHYSSDLQLISIYFRDVAYLEIKNEGKEIFIKQIAEVTNNSFFLNKFLNHIIPYCLYQSKDFALHSSGITNGAESLIFLGKSGSGKSSLSASFDKFSFLAEDSIRVAKEENYFVSYPSYPYAKLTDEIAGELNLKKEKKLRIENDRLVRSSYFMKKHETNKTKIRGAFFLEWGEKFKIQQLDFKNKFARVIQSHYTAFPLGKCKESEELQFKQITSFIKAVPCFLITRNKSDMFKNNRDIIKFIDFDYV
tara:strand:+ start:2109 stop:3008 length:900 start_codon:yes stop_codon:yes gene_type:complete